MRTDYSTATEVQEERNWFIVDAQGYVLGRLASNIARILRGKHKPNFAPHQDVGDFVIVINAEKVKLTGRKAENMYYFKHSGYPGGGKKIPFQTMIEKHPTRVIEHAVRLMLPKNILGRKMFKKLKVYAGADHPHRAQKPQPINFE